jgi:hypothetical protein
MPDHHSLAEAEICGCPQKGAVAWTYESALAVVQKRVAGVPSDPARERKRLAAKVKERLKRGPAANDEEAAAEMDLLKAVSAAGLNDEALALLDAHEVRSRAWVASQGKTFSGENVVFSAYFYNWGIITDAAARRGDGPMVDRMLEKLKPIVEEIMHDDGAMGVIAINMDLRQRFSDACVAACRGGIPRSPKNSPNTLTNPFSTTKRFQPRSQGGMWKRCGGFCR